MTIGRIFGIINLIVSMITSCLLVYVIALNVKEGSPLNLTQEKYIKIWIWIIISYFTAFIIGIVQLCIMTAPKTNYRGFHITNGTLSMLSFLVLPVFGVFFISILIIVLEEPVFNKK